jgi:hypothetical protein
MMSVNPWDNHKQAKTIVEGGKYSGINHITEEHVIGVTSW